MATESNANGNSREAAQGKAESGMITVLKKENPYREASTRWARHQIVLNSKTVAEATEAIKKEGMSVGGMLKRAVEKGLINSPLAGAFFQEPG